PVRGGPGAEARAQRIHSAKRLLGHPADRGAPESGGVAAGLPADRRGDAADVLDGLSALGLRRPEDGAAADVERAAAADHVRERLRALRPAARAPRRPAGLVPVGIVDACVHPVVAAAGDINGYIPKPYSLHGFPPPRAGVYPMPIDEFVSGSETPDGSLPG